MSLMPRGQLAQSKWLPWSPTPLDSHQVLLFKKHISGLAHSTGADWWHLSPGSLTHCPGLSPGTREGALEGDKSWACRREGVGSQPNQDLWARS